MAWKQLSSAADETATRRCGAPVLRARRGDDVAAGVEPRPGRLRLQRSVSEYLDPRLGLVGDAASAAVAVPRKFAPSGEVLARVQRESLRHRAAALSDARDRRRTDRRLQPGDAARLRVLRLRRVSPRIPAHAF